MRATLAALVLLGPALLGAARGGSGETVPLSGGLPGERLDVTLVRVVDPASAAPDDADRLVAVQLRLENTGSAVYKDSPASCAHLLDTAGRRFAGLNASVPAGPAFPRPSPSTPAARRPVSSPSGSRRTRGSPRCSSR